MNRTPAVAILSSQIFMAALWFCLSAHAARYYVSPNGADTNVGTSPAAAWQTVARVNTVDLQPGDMVSFEGEKSFQGTLELDVNDGGSATNHVIITSYGTGRATIDGGTADGVRVTGSTGVTFRNCNIAGAGRNENLGGCGLLILKSAHVVVNDVEVSGFMRAGVMIAGASSHVRVTHVYAHDNGYAGICTGWRYKGGVNRHIYIGHCRAIRNPGVSNKALRDQYVRDQSGSGINCYYVEDGLVEYCEAAENGGDFEHTAENGPVGIWFAFCQRVVVQHCISHNNLARRARDGHIYGDGGGFDFDSGNKDCLIQYCYSYDNQGAGFLLCAYAADEHNALRNNTVRYCVSENDGIDGPHHKANVHVHNASAQFGMQIYNNTFYNSNGRHNVNGTLNKEFSFRNNIMVLRAQGRSVAVGGLLEDNCYWNYDQRIPVQPGCLIQDPRLVAPGGGEKLTDPTRLPELLAYKLLPGSPCIDAGLDLSGRFSVNVGKRDFYGNAIPGGASYDVGAYEHTGTAENRGQPPQAIQTSK
jgi:hypothetical protein